EAFEGEKENVLPRRQGRRAIDLIAAFNTDPEERQEEISLGHEKFAREIENEEELDDPLDVYLRYIDWTESIYPQGHNQGSDLLGLLEHTTQRFQNHTQYKNDARYLQCWLQYVQFADQPNEIYQLLIKKGIGQELALFYESYANYLERRGRLKEAGDIYRAGIDREARPLRRLQRHYEAFQNR
ncbi:Mad3/BUB1 homology region 1-domain-containing protein, partial [Dichotomocladium elegans]